MKFANIKFTKFLSKISTIHGLSYIGDGKASKFSKIFWISALICSFLGCFFFFLQVYEKVFVVPDISITIGYRQLNEFPFPAITICPHNKVSIVFDDNSIFVDKFSLESFQFKRISSVYQDKFSFPEGTLRMRTIFEDKFSSQNKFSL